MKKNYHTSFKLDVELESLINETLSKLNRESAVEIAKSNFIRAALRRFCMLLKSGSLKSTEFLFDATK